MVTKEKKNEYNRKWKKKNYQKVLEINKKWRKKNPEKVLAQSKNYRKKNREKINNNSKKFRTKNPLYSIDMDYKECNFSSSDYLVLIKKQQNKCAICKTKKERLFVDHCHTKKIVRGLLCNHCNSVLGYAKDDIKILKTAIKYLEKHA